MSRQRLFRALIAMCATATTLTVPIVASPASPALAYVPATSNVNQPIPSGQPVNSSGPMRPITIEVLDQGRIVDVDVAIRVVHPVSRDLAFYIAHPDGTRIELTTANGGGQNYGSGSENCSGNLTVFDDEASTSVTAGQSPFAGSYKPEMILGRMDTLPAAGRWTFEGNDSTDAGVGAVKCVELRFTLDTGNVVTVTTTNDVVDATDGLVSLREAFENAPGDRGSTTITLAPNATYALRCGNGVDENANRDGDLDLRDVGTEQLTIEGNGATITAPGCTDDRLIDVSGVDSVTLRNLTLADSHGRGAGGALKVAGTKSVALDHIDVRRTTTSEPRICTTACEVLGAVTLRGITTVSITDSTISGNTTTVIDCTTQCSATGGLHVVATGGVTILRSVIASNVAEVSATCTQDCRALAAGARVDANFATIDSTSVTSNQATTGTTCTGCAAAGGLMLNTPGTSVVINSTISDNRVVSRTSQGGGVLRFAGQLQLTGSTVVDNTATDGANLFLQSNELVTVSASVIGSSNGLSGCSVSTATIIAINSFESGVDCRLPTDKGSTTGGGDPRLQPLTGVVPVRVPDRGSPLIDRVPVGFCPSMLDQVGTRRAIGPRCDIGAIEAPLDADRPRDPQSATKFVALPPARLFDTRPDQPGPGPKGIVPADGTIDVQITGIGGVPIGNVAAVVLTSPRPVRSAPGT